MINILIQFQEIHELLGNSTRFRVMIHDSKETFFDDSIASPNTFYFGSGDEKAVLVTKTNINAINTEKNPCIEEHISTRYDCEVEKVSLVSTLRIRT